MTGYCRVEPTRNGFDTMSGEEEWTVCVRDDAGGIVTEFVANIDEHQARLIRAALQRVPVTAANRILEGREREPLPAVKGSIAEQLRSTKETIADLTDMLNGEGAHVTHTQEQIGRCVHCSCGARAQGKLKQIRGE